jgi:hypothetical protein
MAAGFSAAPESARLQTAANPARTLAGPAGA